MIKEPNGSHAADVVMSLLPRSRLIFLIRDGRDVIDSLMHANAADWTSGPDMNLSVEREEQRIEFVKLQSQLWLENTKGTERAYDSHPPELRARIRYEDLRADTPAALTPLARWLDPGFGDELLETAAASLSFESYPPEAKGPQSALRAATPGLWRQNMTAVEQALMNEIMGERLRDFGYEV